MGIVGLGVEYHAPEVPRTNCGSVNQWMQWVQNLEWDQSPTLAKAKTLIWNHWQSQVHNCSSNLDEGHIYLLAQGFQNIPRVKHDQQAIRLYIEYWRVEPASSPAPGIAYVQLQYQTPWSTFPASGNNPSFIGKLALEKCKLLAISPRIFTFHIRSLHRKT